LVLDAALAEVVSGLAARGLRAVLLKGPAIARWLYDDPLARRYGDIDLLVDPARLTEVEAAVAALGFARVQGAAPHHAVWDRPGPVPVRLELHHTLYWARCTDAVVWSTLSCDTAELVIAGERVDVPSLPARLLVIALHAAQHGRDFTHALSDLDLALERVEPSAWRGAAELAERFGALEPFGGGLRLRPRGAQLADALGIPDTGSRELVLRLRTPPATAMGFERLVTAAGARRRVRLLASELVPSPGFMRLWQPMGRRGRLGLAVAYLWRPLWLLWKAPDGLRAWWAAQRRTTGSGPDC
jgi:hypothetical protein